MPTEIHKDDVGTGITILVKDCDGIVNLSSATEIQLVFYKPNKERMVVTPTLLTDGTDGKIRYIVEPGDLDIIGLWRYQVIVTIDDYEWNSDVGQLKVFPNI